MTEKDLKFWCKQFVEHGNRSLTRVQKEIIKYAIDRAHSYNELLEIALIYSGANNI